MRGLLRRFSRSADGTSALEFGLCAPVVILVILWTFDLAFALFTKNNFNNAVGEASRSIYLDPGSDNTDVQDDLDAAIAKWGRNPTTDLAKETHDGVEFWVLTATLDYDFRTPFLGEYSWHLVGEARAPVIDYN